MKTTRKQAKKYGSLRHKISKLLDRYHSAQDCSHKGNCLTKEDVVEKFEHLLEKEREKIKDARLNYAKCKKPCKGCDYNEGWNDCVDYLLEKFVSK